MKIKILKVGPLETNVYILEKDDEVLLIDPGDDASVILDAIGEKELVGIIITHYHFDHIGALEEVRRATHTKVYDYKNLKDGQNKIGAFTFLKISTPGHKEDSISLYFDSENVLFAGDFIFEGTIGRWDLDGGNFMEMKESIKKILEYNYDMTIYPGHGNSTTLNDEKVNLENYLKYFLKIQKCAKILKKFGDTYG